MLEKEIEQFFKKNLYLIENGLKLIGQQYSTPIGIIDLLCKDREGNVIVIEIKKKKGTDKSVGQILRYLDWADKNYEENVRGILLINNKTKKLRYALNGSKYPIEIKYIKNLIPFFLGNKKNKRKKNLDVLILQNLFHSIQPKTTYQIAKEIGVSFNSIKYQIKLLEKKDIIVCIDKEKRYRMKKKRKVIGSKIIDGVKFNRVEYKNKKEKEIYIIKRYTLSPLLMKTNQIIKELNPLLKKKEKEKVKYLFKLISVEIL